MAVHPKSLPLKMSMTVNVFASLIKRLRQTSISIAVLYGLKSENSITVVTFLNDKHEESMEDVLPAGLDPIGIFADNVNSIPCDCTLALAFKDEHLKCFTNQNENLEELEFATVDDIPLATLRIKTKLPIQLSSKDEETDILLDKLLVKINSDSAAFVMEQSHVVIICNGEKSILYGIPQDLLVDELRMYQIEDGEEAVGKSKRANNKQNSLHFKLYWSSVSEDTVTGIPQCAPLIYHQKRMNPMLCLTVSLDAVAVIPWVNQAEDIGPLLSTALTRQLKLIIAQLKQQMTDTALENVELPEIVHFSPESLKHFVSLAMDVKKADDSLGEMRKQLHKGFGIPEDRPVFRRGNKHWFPEDLANSPYLHNTHIGLNLNGNGVALVHGRYAYHHYMQDNFDDNGWGCAYRSLQTIISWFRLQGYTERPVPSHKEIQECLVKIGDKPSTFIGSRQWIGSMEVSFCLQTLIGVESTILNVSSGSEMNAAARQIAHHFRTHGTPIMIGGGVLAHTIIGIDINEDTGNARFLILDPHYTGYEDLRVIQNKGWCNWKPSTFWDSNAFYNLCMPLRPITC